MPRSRLTDRARELRADQTRAEALLWSVLRDRKLSGLKWRRQVPVGPFIVDFLCREAGLVVEVDGGTHDDAAYDARRTAYLEAKGLQVIRFTNTTIREGRTWVCDAILAEVGARRPSPQPSPRTRGGGASTRIVPSPRMRGEG